VYFAVSMRTECSRVMIKYGTPRSKSHTFNSPNFPQAYPASIACVLYWFVGDANHIVQLRFLEFDLEAASHALPSRSSRYVSCDYRIYPPPGNPSQEKPHIVFNPDHNPNPKPKLNFNPSRDSDRNF